jgi:acyl-CoA synthetase (AMP-forming)/AMP-acid ligase II
MGFANTIRVVDNGVDVPPGEVGEIVISNGALMKGYWQDEAATRERLRNGWLYTNDLGRIERGFLFYVGRKTEMIRRRGENISPIEVELCLQGHPNVRECAVFGVPSELSDQEVAVAIVPAKKGFDVPSFVEWCSKRLAPYKVPRFISIVSSLPKGPTEKVVREDLVAAWAVGDLPSIDRQKFREVAQADGA